MMEAWELSEHKAELVYEFAKKGHWATVMTMAEKFFEQEMFIADHEARKTNAG